MRLKESLSKTMPISRTGQYYSLWTSSGTFFGFATSMLALNQSKFTARSEIRFDMMLSMLISQEEYYHSLTRSTLNKIVLIKMLIKRGPIIEPCRTPREICSHLLKQVSILVFWCLLLRLHVNRRKLWRLVIKSIESLGQFD